MISVSFFLFAKSVKHQSSVLNTKTLTKIRFFVHLLEGAVPSTWACYVKNDKKFGTA